jgi:hypothetical protein
MMKKQDDWGKPRWCEDQAGACRALVQRAALT